MEMVSVETGFTGRRRNWGSGGYFNSGRLIGLVLIFKSQLTSLVETIFEKITSESSGI